MQVYYRFHMLTLRHGSLKPGWDQLQSSDENDDSLGP